MEVIELELQTIQIKNLIINKTPKITDSFLVGIIHFN